MKILFENEDHMIVVEKGLFGLGHPLFARLYVVRKPTWLTTKIVGRERAFLTIVLNGLRRGGKTPFEIANVPFLEEFSEAVVSGNGSVLWRACFLSQTPEEVVRRELGMAPRDANGRGA